MLLLPAGRITGSTAGSARTTRLTIRFFRRRTAGTAGESALRHFRGHAFSDSVSHLGRLTGVGIGIFSKCCQRAAQDKHCRKYDRKISFHSETSFLTGREMQVPSVDEKTSLTADNVIIREVD